MTEPREVLAAHALAPWSDMYDWHCSPECGAEGSMREGPSHADHLLEALREAGWELVKLPEPTTEPVEDEDRPKMPGDYLKRDDTKSEVWIEGLPDEPPYVFFGHRGMGPSYFPAEFARDVAAALLAAAKDADA